MADEVYTRLGKSLSITPAEAKALWARRVDLGKITSDLYTYGLGSWLLGPDRVVAGTKVEGKGNDKTKGAPQDDPELDRVIRRMRDAADRAKRAAQSRAARNQQGQGQDQEETDEQWWANADHDDKESWLRAYFAEFGGQMEVVLAIASPCHNCSARGTITVVGTTGREQQEPCPVCHRTRFVRSLRAR